jgi:predicted acyltransferase
MTSATLPSRATLGRFAGLDALRGFAILTMVLSGTVPEGILPSWMYHCQVPPPHHKFDPTIAGITWVDLVFPFFLFCLGAAIPFALQRRMERGLTPLQAVGVTLKRGFLLFTFAIYQAHFSPYNLKTDPDWLRWVYALAGFVLLFPMMMRLPDSLAPAWHWAIRAVGWGGAAVLLSRMRYASGSPTFSLYRSNIILMLLTVSAVFGSLAWLFTRGNHLLRVGLLGFVMAHRLACGTHGWVKWLSDLVSVPGIWDLSYAHYLFIVIPASMAGDFMLQWTRQRDAGEKHSWANWRYGALAALGVALMLVELVGLKARWVEATVVVSAVLIVAGLALVRKPGGETEAFLQRMVQWGGYWLLLGLAFEPYEGGIKKDPNTMSYFFVTTGLALYLIVTFTVLLDLWGVKCGAHLLVANGQNPMIAYVGMGNLIHPLLALTGLGTLLERLMPGPWLGTLQALLLTLLLAWIVSIFTRFKVFWRT